MTDHDDLHPDMPATGRTVSRVIGRPVSGPPLDEIPDAEWWDQSYFIKDERTMRFRAIPSSWVERVGPAMFAIRPPKEER